MKTRILIIIAIILTSIVFGTSSYVVSVQSQCESLLGDTHYPRPLTFWNCLDYLEVVEDDKYAQDHCGAKYMIVGNNECVLNPEFIEPLTVIIYDVTDNNGSRLSIAPHSLIFNLKDGDTVTFVNNGANTVNILDKSKGLWRFDDVEPSSQRELTINGTGFYQFLVQNSREGESGDMVALSEGTNSLPVEVRAKMAQSIVSSNFRQYDGLNGVGSGGAEPGITIHIDEKFRDVHDDAEKFYYEKYQKIIPFDVPIWIKFTEPMTFG